MPSLEVFFDPRPNKRLSKQSIHACDLKRHGANYDVTVMMMQILNMCAYRSAGHQTTYKCVCAIILVSNVQDYVQIKRARVNLEKMLIDIYSVYVTHWCCS